MIKNYKVDQYGVIHQQSRQPFVYDKNYIDTSYGNLVQLTDEMAYLRLGYIIGAIGRVPQSILDVGYGTGDFLKVCTRIVNQSAGHDLFRDLLPAGCEFVEDITAQHYDVITFFDSLEHYPDIDFVQKLNCNYAVVSLPWCHNTSDAWFDTWKHRKPDEHLHHFNLDSLTQFMKSQGFTMISYSNVEDIIRTTKDGLPNILTAVFEKND
jgi:hypothetical protein